jgi:transposase
MGRHELTDEQYARVEPLLPANGSRGGQWKDHRPLLNGMVWRLKTGCPWRDLPERFGPWQTVYDRFNRWSADGTLLGIAECLLAELDTEGKVDWDLWCIDGSVIRASRAAGGARADSVGKKVATGASTGSRRTTPWAAAGAGSGPSCT